MPPTAWGVAIAAPSPVAAPSPRAYPASPRFGQYTAFTVTCRRLIRIWRFASQFAGASPIRLAFAAGQIRLASHPGASQGEWSNFKPAGPHFSVPAASASRGVVFTLPWRGRSAPPRRRSTSSVPAGPPFRGFRLRSERAAPHLPRGLPLFRREPHPAVCPCRLRRSRRLSAFLQSGYPYCSGLRAGVAFRLRRPGPFQAIFPAFIDSRSGLSQQPYVSVRVTSR